MERCGVAAALGGTGTCNINAVCGDRVLECSWGITLAGKVYAQASIPTITTTTQAKVAKKCSTPFLRSNW